MKRVVYYDLETGGRELHHPITQIGAIAVDEFFTIKDQFEIKIKFNPEECEQEALDIIGYTPEKWADAVEPKAAAQMFAAFLKKNATVQKTSKKGGTYRVARLAGFNNARFDDARIQNFYKELGEFFPAEYRTLDVIQLVYWFFELTADLKTISPPPENMKLTTLCQHFGIKLENAHDALADCTATALLAQHVKETLNGLDFGY